MIMTSAKNLTATAAQVNTATAQRNHAKPFLKWAGGKSQILEELTSRLPEHIRTTRIIEQYVEPFVGGGALFFFLKNHLKVKKSYLFDINPELIIAYKVINKDPRNLIEKLTQLDKKYIKKTEKGRKQFYYEIRRIYNAQISDINYAKYRNNWIERTSYMIFLNKTCYNGLFRLNKKGEFNVPYGRYKKPKICDSENIIASCISLRSTTCFAADFSDSIKNISKNSFVYLDPPYRPISHTSSFTSYAKQDFGESDQIRLANFCNDISNKGAYFMLSNSDPKNENPNDNFFENLYSSFNIERVKAKRFINCNVSNRGEIMELIIRNYR